MGKDIGSSETTSEALKINLSEYGKAIVAATEGAAAVAKGGKKIGRIKNSSVVNQAVGISQSGIVSKEKQEFLEWFIGFAEGDGSFVVAGADQPIPTALIFSIDQKDRKVIDKVQKGLGFGQIHTEVGDNKDLCQYWASSFADVTSLVHLFNGNITFNKVQARFKRWLEDYNKRYLAIDYISSPVLFKPRQPTVTLESAWLAGLIDAEGSFLAYHRTIPPASIRTKFRISQKFEKPVLEEIRDCFRRSVNIRITSKSPKLIISTGDMHRLEFNSLPLFSAVSKYLDNHPLRGRKRLIFFRWLYVIENRSFLHAKIPQKAKDRYLKLVSGIQKSKN